MHTRKARMAELSDGFIALPGGFGTFEEFCEILTWGQLGFHVKPMGLLNLNGFYDPLLALFDRAVDEGFLRAPNRAMRWPPAASTSCSPRCGPTGPNRSANG